MLKRTSSSNLSSALSKVIVNGWFKLINKIQEVSWHIISVSLTSLEWNVSVFFCYFGIFSFVFATLSDVWGGASCLFCPLCRNVTAGGCGHIFGFTATSSKCFNRQGKENKLAKTQRSDSLNIMTKIQNTLTKATRLNMEFIAQEVGLLHQRVELLICQKESIIDVPCCDWFAF